MQKDLPKIPLILSMLFLAIFTFSSFFFWKAIGINNKETQLRETEWQRESSRRSEMQALQDILKMTANEQVALATHFAQSSDIVPFLDTIEALASGANIKAEFISVNIAKDQRELLVEMKISGTFDGLYKFLMLLENSPYELSFSAMEMHGQKAVNVEEKNLGVPEWNGVFRIKLLSFVQY